MSTRSTDRTQATYTVVDMANHAPLATGCGQVPRRGETLRITEMTCDSDNGFDEPEYSPGKTSVFEVADVVWPVSTVSPYQVFSASCAKVYVFRRTAAPQSMIEEIHGVR